MTKVTKAQATALAWAIHRFGGFIRSWDAAFLEIRDSTVAALVDRGLAHDAYFYDSARRWRWHWFRVADKARSIPAVLAEIARLKEYDEREARRSREADDEALAALEP